MSKVSWGTKRTCPSCGSHFYDLEKTPATCPKCAYSFDPAALLKPRRGRSLKRADVPAVPSAADMIAAEAKKQDQRKKNKPGMGKTHEDSDTEPGGEGIEDMEELGEIDEIGVEDMEDTTASEDDADEENIMEELQEEGSVLIDAVEDEAVIEEEEEIEEIEEELEEEEKQKQGKPGKRGSSDKKKPAKDTKKPAPKKTAEKAPKTAKTGRR